MPAKKYLRQVAGRLKEFAAVVVSAGSGNDGDLVALDASGKLDASVLPAGIGQNTVAVVASESLASGDLVNLWDNAGTLNARKADATAEGKEAHGFVMAAYSASQSATVYLDGNNITGLSGLTPGATYYLSTTAGGKTSTAPSATGNVVQPIGTALSATILVFDAGENPVTIA